MHLYLTPVRITKGIHVHKR